MFIRVEIGIGPICLPTVLIFLSIYLCIYSIYIIYVYIIIWISVDIRYSISALRYLYVDVTFQQKMSLFQQAIFDCLVDPHPKATFTQLRGPLGPRACQGSPSFESYPA